MFVNTPLDVHDVFPCAAAPKLNRTPTCQWCEQPFSTTAPIYTCGCHGWLFHLVCKRKHEEHFGERPNRSASAKTAAFLKCERPLRCVGVSAPAPQQEHFDDLQGGDENITSTSSKAPAEAPNVGCQIPPDLSFLEKKGNKTGIHGNAMAFSMTDYCIDAVNLYKSITGSEKLKKVTTPFCPDGSLVHADDCSQG